MRIGYGRVSTRDQHLLQARGVDLVVLDQGIDTSTAVGRLFFQIIGAIGEFEHALMRERTMDGLAAARAPRADRRAEAEALAPADQARSGGVGPTGLHRR